MQLWTAISAGNFGAFLYHSLTNFLGVTPSEMAPHATTFVLVSFFRVWIPSDANDGRALREGEYAFCFIARTISRRVS